MSTVLNFGIRRAVASAEEVGSGFDKEELDADVFMRLYRSVLLPKIRKLVKASSKMKRNKMMPIALA